MHETTMLICCGAAICQVLNIVNDLTAVAKAGSATVRLCLAAAIG
jgi:hypothetical protein